MVELPYAVFPVALMACAETDQELFKSIEMEFSGVAGWYMRDNRRLGFGSAFGKAIDECPQDMAPFVYEDSAITTFTPLALMGSLRSFAFVHPERPMDHSVMLVERDGCFSAKVVPFADISRNRTIRLLPSTNKMTKADGEFVAMLAANQPTVRFDFAGSAPRLLVSMPFPAEEVFASCEPSDYAGNYPASIVAFRHENGTTASEKLCDCTLRPDGNTMGIETDPNGLMLLSAAAAKGTAVQVVPTYGWRDFGIVFRVPALSGDDSVRPAWCPVGRIINPLESKRWTMSMIRVPEEKVLDFIRKLWWMGSGSDFLAMELAKENPRI